MRLSPWLIGSLAVALAAFFTGLIGFDMIGGPLLLHSASALPISLVLSIAWIVVLLAAVVVHRWRGLWLLTGIPLALFSPTMFVLFAWAITACQAVHPARDCLP